MPRTQITTLLLSLATLSVPALAQGTNPAVRDYSSALNYVQGQATLDGQPVTTSANAVPRLLHPGDVLSTTQGTADLMLAPGALLRLGQGSSVQLVAHNGRRAEARLESGHANLAVNFVRPNRLLLLDMPQGQTQVLKQGLYTFDVPSDTARVYDGEADAFPGQDTNTAVKPVKVKDDHEVTFDAAKLHPTKFDRDEADEDLLPWTGPQETRAALADGAVTYQGGDEEAGGGGSAFAPVGYAGYGYGGFGFGYPAPYFAYGWPYGFYDYPFGWGGYPWMGMGMGFYGGGWGGGYYGGRSVLGGYGLRHGYGGGGYGSASRGFAGGGFHGGGGFGGGGGFHGGGGGGGGRR